MRQSEESIREETEYNNFMSFISQILNDMKKHPCRLVAIDGKAVSYKGDADYGVGLREEQVSRYTDWDRIK